MDTLYMYVHSPRELRYDVLHQRQLLLKVIVMDGVPFQFVRQLGQKLYGGVIFEHGLSNGRDPLVDEMNHSTLAGQNELPVLFGVIHPIGGPELRKHSRR